MVMARSRGDLGALGNDAQWRPAPLRPGARVWTDDYSSPLNILKWY
jgi:hypothetical protein